MAKEGIQQGRFKGIILVSALYLRILQELFMFLLCIFRTLYHFKLHIRNLSHNLYNRHTRVWSGTILCNQHCQLTRDRKQTGSNPGRAAAVQRLVWLAERLVKGQAHTAGANKGQFVPYHHYQGFPGSPQRTDTC